MFLFTFTKLRKQIFAALLSVFIIVPFLFLIFILLSFLSIGLWGLIFYFFLPAALTWAIIGYGHFFEGDIGIGPNGAGGVVITLIFYGVLAFLLSLVGNFKKDTEPVTWRAALSNQYLKKLFLSIAGAAVIAIGVFAGIKLDQYFQTPDIFTVVLSLLGVIAGIYLAIKDFIKPKKK